MPNGKEMLGDLEFEQRIGELSDRELQEFTARQVFEVRKVSANHEQRIAGLEGRSRKAFAFSGGAGTFVGGVIVGLINFFYR